MIPELDALARIAAMGATHLEVQADTVAAPDGSALPLYRIAMGNPHADAAVGFFGGVHGLERIGSQVVIAYLHGLVARLRWDATLHRMLEGLRIVFMPVVNPGGMLRGT